MMDSCGPVVGKGCIYAHIPKTAGTSIIKCMYDSGLIGWYGNEATHYPKGWPKSERDELLFTVVRNPFDRLVSLYYHTMHNVHRQTRPSIVLQLKMNFEEWFDLLFYNDELYIDDIKAEFHPNQRLVRPMRWYEENWSELKFQTCMWMVDFSKQCQTWYLQPDYNKPSELHFDILAKYENINEDWKQIAKMIGANEELPRLNETKERPKDKHYREYFTPEMRDTVLSFMEQDFVAFDYDW